jgi:hypothetical protein
MSDWFQEIVSHCQTVETKRAVPVLVMPESARPKLNVLADSICRLLDWQENKMRLKAEARIRRFKHV